MKISINYGVRRHRICCETLKSIFSCKHFIVKCHLDVFVDDNDIWWCTTLTECITAVTLNFNGLKIHGFCINLIQND
jgi:hypothetical protein